MCIACIMYMVYKIYRILFPNSTYRTFIIIIYSGIVLHKGIGIFVTIPFFLCHLDCQFFLNSRNIFVINFASSRIQVHLQVEFLEVGKLQWYLK